MLTCREISELEPHDALWLQWKNLQTRVRPELSLFGPEWYSIWSQTHGSADRWTGNLRLLCVSDAEQNLQGVMVIAEQRYAGFRIQASGGYFQPWRTILADRTMEAEVGRALGEYVSRSGWLLCQLGPFVGSSPATSAMHESLRDRGTSLVMKSSDQLAVSHVPSTFEEYKQRVLGGKFFRKIGYYERKMSQAGRVEIAHIRCPDAEQAHNMIADLARIEQQSWLVKSARGRTRFSTDVAQSFWKRLIGEALTPNDQFDAWIIRFDDRPVSFGVTLTSQTTRYVIANQYDEAVSEFRTGSTLYRYMIEEGIQRGVRTFDFGDGGIEYKKYWGAEYVDNVETFLVAPHWATSQLLPWAGSAMQWLKNRRRRPAAVEESEVESSEGQKPAVVQACDNPTPKQKHPAPVEEEMRMLNEANALIAELKVYRKEHPSDSGDKSMSR
ncbi:MAG: GNAT family N-acetyltransferase [Planctomycetaceae bacterium]